jgi:hypothetical protein
MRMHEQRWVQPRLNAVHDPDSGLILNTVSPAPRDVWEDALSRDPFALESQSPAWADAMCRSGGFRDASKLYETAEGRMLVLPMLRRSFIGGLVTIDRSNPPACGVGGLLAAGGVRCAEVAAVLDDLSRRRVLAQSVSPGPLEASAWDAAAHPRAAAIQHRVHVLDLQGGWDEVWDRRFNRTSRRGVRYAERQGVTVECGTSGRLLPEYYALMEQAIPRWARLQHEPSWLARRRMHLRDPLEKFEAIGQHLGERFRVWTARVDGRPVAASLVALGNNAHEFRAAMDESMKSYRASDLLQARTIQDACDAGCRYYYLGESGSGPLGTFKERFGARPVDFPEYRFERVPISRVQRDIKKVVKIAIGFKD